MNTVPLETIESRAAAVAERLLAEAGCYRPLPWFVRTLRAAYIAGRREECRDEITGAIGDLGRSS